MFHTYKVVLSVQRSNVTQTFRTL